VFKACAWGLKAVLRGVRWKPEVRHDGSLAGFLGGFSLGVILSVAQKAKNTKMTKIAL
jgi:membrane associated rhomboid family serine protease